MDHLFSHIQKFKDVSVLCVGDLALDLFVYGDVSRISPEAPIPVLHVSRELYALGMVGNVMNNVLALHGKAHVVAVTGEDTEGKKIEDLLKDKDVSLKGVVKAPQRPTMVKCRYSAKEQQLLRVDYEQVGDFDLSVYKKIVANALEVLPKVQVMVLSDYGKGVLHPDHVIKPLMVAALKQGIPVIVDPKGSDYGIYKGATLVTPNRKELKEATKMPTKTDEEVLAAARSLQKKTGIKNVLATRSEEGMTLVEGEGKSTHFKTTPREVYDVSGAGDTVVATVALALGQGLPLEQAVHLANLAGTIVVGKIGTATVSAEELEEALRHEDLDSGYSKIMNISQAQDQVRKWHKKGLKVGFTNGCFDLLHLGHLALLKKSRQECDRLIVAVNSDSSVKKLKGETRPIQNEKTRTEILAALGFVDLVVIFSEDTPYNLIKALEPDVLVKGADYTVDKVVGADVVLKGGGRVVLVDLEEGHSTTNTVKKMRGSEPTP